MKVFYKGGTNCDNYQISLNDNHNQKVYSHKLHSIRRFKDQYSVVYTDLRNQHNIEIDQSGWMKRLRNKIWMEVYKQQLEEKKREKQNSSLFSRVSL